MRRKIKILWRNRKAATRDQRVDRSFASGLAMVALGCGWVWPPLFLIVGGALVATVAWKYGAATTAAAAAVGEGDREDDD